MSNGHPQSRTIQRFVDGQLVGTVETVRRTDEPCDYCGRPGCVWQSHDQAHVDVEQWNRTRRAWA